MVGHDGLEKAVEVGMGAIRAAIHAAGGHTHDWPTTEEALQGALEGVEHYEADEDGWTEQQVLAGLSA